MRFLKLLRKLHGFTGLQYYVITNRQNKGLVWANIQLSRKLPQEDEKNLVLAMQSLPAKLPKLTLAFMCLRENSGTILGQFQFLHSSFSTHCKSSTSFACTHCSFVPRWRGLALSLTPHFQSCVQQPMPQHTL